jgi:hypothetical protein
LETGEYGSVVAAAPFMSEREGSLSAAVWAYTTEAVSKLAMKDFILRSRTISLCLEIYTITVSIEMMREMFSKENAITCLYRQEGGKSLLHGTTSHVQEAGRVYARVYCATSRLYPLEVVG